MYAYSLKINSLELFNIMMSENSNIYYILYFNGELPWLSGYELRLSLERLQVLILVKVIGGQQEGHPVAVSIFGLDALPVIYQ